MKTNSNDSYIETRVALLEQSIIYINETMSRIENRFNDIDKRFDRIEKRLDALDSDIKSNFRYTITTILTLFVLQGFMPIFTHWISKLIG